MNIPLIWLDLEMTGLDASKGFILEIATLITDANLYILDEGPNIAIHHPEEVLSNMEEWSREHHTASGLLERVRASGFSMEQAQNETLLFLKRYCKEGESPLCGNSIWQDRRFLIKDMPRLEAFFYYRNIDVSSIKELVKRWYPSLPSFEKTKSHTALSDIRESVEELRYYREHVFVRFP